MDILPGAYHRLQLEAIVFIDLEKISTRPATPEDSEFVYNLKKAALGEYVAEMWGWDEEFQRDFHNRNFAPTRSEIVVHGRKDIGFVRVEELPDHIYVRHLYILPEAQNQGVGTHLIREITGKGDKKGMEIRLHVLKTNRRAKAFYERLGFSLVGETESHLAMVRSPHST